MKAHLSPSHIHSRKCLHFFLGIVNWSCSPQSSFLFPISPSSHGSSPYSIVVSASAYMNLHIWCHSIVGLKNTSLSAYLPLHYSIYIKLTVGDLRKGNGNPLPLSLLSCTPITGWCKKNVTHSTPTQFPVNCHLLLFIHQSGGGGGKTQTCCQSLENIITSGKLNTSSMTAIKQHTSYWVSTSKPSVAFNIALKSTSLVIVVLDVGNNYCHQFSCGNKNDGGSFHLALGADCVKISHSHHQWCLVRHIRLVRQ